MIQFVADYWMNLPDCAWALCAAKDFFFSFFFFFRLSIYLFIYWGERRRGGGCLVFFFFFLNKPETFTCHYRHLISKSWPQNLCRWQGKWWSSYLNSSSFFRYRSSVSFSHPPGFRTSNTHWKSSYCVL